MDKDGCPTEEELEKVKNWDHKDPLGWFQFSQSLWRYPDQWEVTEWGNGPVTWKNYRVTTGGWSGNEDVIAAMARNWALWGLCWQSSHRGGLHFFALPALLQELAAMARKTP